MRSPGAGVPGRSSEPGHGPDLWQTVAPFCAAVGLGTLAAVLGSVRQVNPALVLQWGIGTALCGALGAATGWWLARGLWQLGRSRVHGAAAGELRRRVILGLSSLAGVLLLGFVLAVVRLPESQRWDTIVGALLAVLVLGTIGWLLIKLRTLFGEPDDEP